MTFLLIVLPPICNWCFKVVFFNPLIVESERRGTPGPYTVENHQLKPSLFIILAEIEKDPFINFWWADFQRFRSSIKACGTSFERGAFNSERAFSGFEDTIPIVMQMSSHHLNFHKLELPREGEMGSSASLSFCAKEEEERAEKALFKQDNSSREKNFRATLVGLARRNFQEKAVVIPCEWEINWNRPDALNHCFEALYYALSCCSFFNAKQERAYDVKGQSFHQWCHLCF
uniref:Uncharacterized protein n=1 Tax=Cucumis melo TaxID=3656 RepID=A0A9I9E9N5_CUCME